VLKRFIAIAAVVTVAACEPPAPPVPFEIVLVTAAPTTQAVGTAVVTVPTFEVRTESGKAIKNVDVVITANASSGSVTSPPLKTTATATPIGTWTLGTTPGTQSVTVSVEDLTPLVISLTAVPGDAASLPLLVGAGQLAAANTAVSGPITVQVQDNFGNSIAGVTVNWAVTAGGGNVASPTSVSNGVGIAAAPLWTLGASGTQTLTATVGAVTRNVNAIVQTPPASINIIRLASDTTALGNAPDSMPTFVVRDAGGIALAGVPVTVTVSSGGGSLTGAPTVTAAGGEPTSIGTWTTGNSVGAQTVTVAVVGVPDLVITTTAAQLYDLNVVYTGTPPIAGVQTAFTNAVARIKNVVTGRMSLVQFPAAFNANACVTGLVINAELIGGLRIYATIDSIDGPGGILGSAGPCYTRTSNGLAVVGRMRFDDDDMANMLANGSLESVILHEMLHVVGVGTLWSSLGLVTGLAPTIPNPMFTGQLAGAACINDHNGTAFCGTGVPVENCQNLIQSCGGGTINGHWKESIFGNELMTGYASAGLNPFSRMTIQALRDMGYRTNLLAADAYTIPGTFMSFFEAPKVRLPAPTGPIAEIDNNGNITRYFPPDR
jgi:hypothetical protein